MLKWLYDKILRTHTPKKVIVHNGIPALTGHLLDSNDHREEWEEMLMAAIRNQSLDGCKVIEVAGGLGICTAEIAKRVGPDGNVISYEVDDDRIDIMSETLALNKVSNTVEVRHEYVEELDEDCDVLVLDCEGSETDILKSDYGNPETIIVETHPIFDVPTSEIRSILERDGYDINCIREGTNIDIIEASQ